MTAPTSDKAGIRQTIRALAAAGWKVDHVWDGEEETASQSEDESIAAITAVDQAWYHVRRGAETGYVFFVLGNDPDEVICDHTINLSDVLDPLTESWF